MIYARVDVRMPTHRRFVNAGPAAVGFWAAALCYSRGEELDGRVPEASLRLILGIGEREARRLADRCCEPDVGLMRPDGEGGYWIEKYDKGNETKAQIDERRAKNAERVDRYRLKRAGNAVCNAVTNAFVTRDGSALPPGSGSVSLSDPSQSSDLGERERGQDPASVVRLVVPPSAASERYVGATEPITQELRDAVCDVGVVDIDTAWIKFTGKNAGKWLHVVGAWRAFCASWRNIERTERDRARGPGGAARAPLVQPVPEGGRGWKVGDERLGGRVAK